MSLAGQPLCPVELLRDVVQKIADRADALIGGRFIGPRGGGLAARGSAWLRT